MTEALAELSWMLEAGDGGPRRPSLADVGGATLEDDTEFPPNPAKHPYANQLNQWAKQIAAMGGVVPSLVLSVEITAGAPAVVAFSCPRDDLEISDFTETDNGTGDTTITWPADTFPPELARPTVTINQDTGALVGGTVVSVTNGVRVRTYDGSGAEDLHFTVVRY
jgi:hypothetical protein